MEHWLEQAENKKQEKVNKSKVSRTKIRRKMEGIKQNYEANKEAYDGFINSLFTTCQRANNLPPEAREPWDNIESQARTSKLDNHYFTFGARERFDKKVPAKTFPFIKTRHYKHVRKIMIAVSETLGMVNIEVYEDYLAKTRLLTDDKSDYSTFIDDGLERSHYIYHYSIKDLNESLMLNLLDWLVFMKDLIHLPFKEKDIKRPMQIRSSE